jgi:tripartite-type tricarboxylate transporter receptor subunit TctC
MRRDPVGGLVLNVRMLLSVLLLFPTFVFGFPIQGKPVRLIVPFPPGAEAFDGTARIIAQRLGPALGITVIVENRPGAGAVIANQAVAQSAPDGHTLLYGVVTSFTMLPHQLSKRPYDEFRDFTPITHVARSPLVLGAHPSVPANNLHELVAYAKAHPGKLSFGSWQFGGMNHVYLEMLRLDSGAPMVHVPYKSPTDSFNDLLEGRIHLVMGGTSAFINLARAGRIKLIGVTSPKRTPALPEVPTFSEQGFRGFDDAASLALLGPANMPRDTVQRLADEMNRILRSREVVDFFVKIVPTFEVEPSSPEELGTLMKAQYDYMGPIIRRLGIRID